MLGASLISTTERWLLLFRGGACIPNFSLPSRNPSVLELQAHTRLIDGQRFGLDALLWSCNGLAIKVLKFCPLNQGSSFRGIHRSHWCIRNGICPKLRWCTRKVPLYKSQPSLRHDAIRKRGLCCRPVSVTLVHCIQTAKDIVKLLSRPGSPIILVFLTSSTGTQF